MVPGGRAAVLALLLVLVAGCPEEDGDAARAGASFGDAEVLEVVRALEHGRVQAVAAARGRLRDEEARRLAADLLDEARAARERAVVLGERLALPLRPTPLSEELERAGAARQARWLEAPAAPATEWAREQVEAQRAALDAIDAHLLPAARAPEVRELVRDLRRTAEQHLRRARACAAGE